MHVLVDKLPYVTLLLRVRGNTEVERRALARRRAFDTRVTALVVRGAGRGVAAQRHRRERRVAPRLRHDQLDRRVVPAGRREDADRLADDVVAVALDGLRMPTSNRVVASSADG